MRGTWIRRLGWSVFFLICVWVAFSLGTNFGIGVGKAFYHNEKMRIVEGELFELRKVIDEGDLDKARKKVQRIVEIAGAAADDEKFQRVLSDSLDLNVQDGR